MYYADDLEPGQLIPLGSYTITEEEIVTYARQWDPVFIHTDPTAAATTPLGGVIASGLHTLAIYQRLAVPAFWSRFTGGVPMRIVNGLAPVFASSSCGRHLGR
ncbi:hypothetical protein G6009_13545 [Dietzia sp. SLG510A3-30A2]|nr:hypothetical protein [Dietzia sp. SLG510A3-30A2]